jgi:hypothetical protein
VSEQNFNFFGMWREWIVRSEQQWSENLSKLLVQGGHVGLVAGRGAEQRMWPALEAWLADRCV